ncbi:CD209 antigen-like protein E isoform X1 [Toxotes jaculatrix]|uniref:CD209 antigen-like protein E isoform X1 n=1 Tax=Toxotes jaculatrix TaxID=941984 RepID=UPI001B3AD6C1|nr:CD209 antigen-like protein E isoform X1 [Toxotes jaculatrix]
MELSHHEDNSAISMVYENFHGATVSNAALQSHSVEDTELPAVGPEEEQEEEENKKSHPTPGIKLYKVVAVSFVLLCILQVTLNISQRHILYFETSHQNLTEENVGLKRTISDTEARCKNQAEERDKMERKLNTLVSQYNSLTEETDKVKRLLKNGWVYFRDSLYYISSTEKTWQESRNYCIQEGADLMIINSKEEQSFTRQFKKFMWFGLTDAESEGTWKWVDGTPLARSFWGSGEPNGNTSENCGEIKNPDSDNNWNDEGCSISHFWICEKNFS